MPEYNPKVRRRIYYQQSLAFLLIITIAVVGFIDNAKDREALCRQGYENRLAIRHMTSAIVVLGQNLVLGAEPRQGEITPEQQAALAQFRQFQNQQLEQLPLPAC